MQINLDSVAAALSEGASPSKPVLGSNGVVYRHRQPPAPPRASPVEHKVFTIDPGMLGVAIHAPEQRVATAPFQPPAAQQLLRAVYLRYRWQDLRGAFAALDACEPDTDHPATPWLERIAAHVRDAEPVEILIAPWCITLTTIQVRSVWTGLPRGDLLLAAQSTGCADHGQAVARADAVASRLRAAGRKVIITDTISAEQRREAREARELAAANPKPDPSKFRQVRVGILTINVPLEARP